MNLTVGPDWSYDRNRGSAKSDEQLRRRVGELMNAWKAAHPKAVEAPGDDDDFTRLPAAMRNVWRAL